MIYLASTSPRRKKLLKNAQVIFKVIHPPYKEEKHLNKRPSNLVQMHAIKKAESCLSKIQDGVIIGADTIVYFDRTLISKPENMQEAHYILGRLQGEWHWVYTGVAILKVVSNRMIKQTVFFEKTRVRLQALSSKAIKAYFKKIDPLDKAGAYAIQSSHGSIVQEVRGSFSNAVGLPIKRSLKLLRTLCMIIICLSLVFPYTVHADVNQLVNGVVRTVSAPFELPKGIFSGFMQPPFPFGLLAGTFSGAVKTVTGVLSGVKDVALGSIPFWKGALPFLL
jgi:septum formation protein